MNSVARWTGGCLCGACRYEFTEEPLYAGFCHCNMCKRGTGGGFAVLVQARKSSLKWIADKPCVYRSSAIATRGFCQTCGSPLFLQYDDDDLIRLTSGSLDRPADILPSGHYGVESKLVWADIGRGLPEEETQEQL